MKDRGIKGRVGIELRCCMVQKMYLKTKVVREYCVPRLMKMVTVCALHKTHLS